MVEIHIPDSLSAYTLTSAETIQEKLQVLQRLGSLLRISWKGGKAGTVSTILKVIPEKGMIALDTIQSEELSRSLLAANELSFSTTVDGADVRFKAEQIQEAILNGKDVMAVPIPTALIWVQRRECYRVPISRTATVLCRIPLPNDEVGEFEVLNVSLLGLAVLDKSGRLDYWGRIGQVFNNCRLLLEGFRDESVSLEIRNKRNTAGSRARHSSTRVGFAFRNVSRTFAKKLQRYISALERETRHIMDE